MEPYKNFINGEWVVSKTQKFAENRNPANTDEVLGLAPISPVEEAQAAINAAQAAYATWRKLPPPQRGQYIAKAALIMQERKEELAKALTLEEGKTFKESLGEVQKSINIMDFMAGESRRIGGETLYSELANNLAYTLKQPMGVVSTITPWNFPVSIPAWKIAPALVAGNTVVFKPATLTPWTAVLVVEIFRQAGLPPGVLNMVMGSGSGVGEEFVSNPVIRAISFTGSNDVGTHIYNQGAKRMVKVQCEMGGKNPVVILEDADLDLAVEGTVMGAFGSTGQRCTATSRVIVVEPVADKLSHLLAERARALRVGPGIESTSDMGPSVDKSQMETVLHYIDVGKKEGAKLLCGGERLSGRLYDKGYFVAPTIFDHVTPGMTIAQEEIFGPVLSIIRVKDFDEALHVANNVKYGLTSSIYTTDAAKIFQFTEEIETGITHVNSPTVGGEAHLPFGGIKGTGMGWREQGKTAIDFYTEIKTVYVDYTGRKRESSIY